MNYMGNTQPARNNPSLQHAVEQGGYLAPPDTRLRFNARLTDSLTDSSTSLLSTQGFSPNRQETSALPIISPHQPTFAHLPLTLFEQLKDNLTVREEERSSAQKELEKRAASPKLIVLMHFLEKYGGPKNIPENATPPVKEIPITALRGLYGEQVWALCNLFHTLPSLLVPCRNLSSLIKKAEERPRASVSYQPFFLSPFFEELSPLSFNRKLLNTLKKGTKPSPLGSFLSLFLLSLQESERDLPLLQTLQKIEHKLTPLFFEEKKALNQQGLLLIFVLTGVQYSFFTWLSAELGEDERAKKVVLAGFSAAFTSTLTKILYEMVQKEPPEIRLPFQVTAIVVGLLQLLLFASYFEDLNPQLIRTCFPVTQTVLFSDPLLSITKAMAKHPELVHILQKCHDITSKETSAKDMLVRLENLLLPFFDLEGTALKTCAESASALTEELMPLYSLV